MPRYVRIWLWSTRGEPLLAELADDPGYQRKTIGFMPPEAREKEVESASGVGVVGPPDQPNRVDEQGQSAQGIWVHSEAEEGKEGQS